MMSASELKTASFETKKLMNEIVATESYNTVHLSRNHVYVRCGVDLNEKDAKKFEKNRVKHLLSKLKYIKLYGHENEQLFIDQSRMDLLKYFCRACAALDSNDLHGNTFNRVVVGVKGTGKSSFLQGLALAIQSSLRTTHAMWCDMSNMDLVAFPSALHFVCEGLQSFVATPVYEDLFRFADAGDVAEFSMTLRRNKIHILLILDEYVALFSSNAIANQKWLRQIYAIGNGAQCDFLTILSDSSAYLQPIVFGRIEQTIKRQFPALENVFCNLNSQRFRVSQLLPMREENELKTYLNSLKTRTGVEQLSSRGWFELTGGVRRNIDYACLFLGSPDDEDSMESILIQSTFDHAAKYSVVYKLMVNVLEDIARNEEGFLHNPWNLIHGISVSELKSKGHFDENVLYDAANHSAIVFQQTKTADTVSFVTPLQFYVARDRLRATEGEASSWFTERLRVALRYPYGILGIEAEEALRRGLSSALAANDNKIGSVLSSLQLGAVQKNEVSDFYNRILRVKFIKRTAEIAKYSVELTERGKTKGQEGFDTLSATSIVTDELPDRLGADIIRVETSEEAMTPAGGSKGMVVMHRIQVKLGKGKFGEAQAKEAEEKLKKGKTAWVTYNEKEAVPFRCHLYLATTRPCNPSVRRYLQDRSITLLDREILAHLWPTCVTKWAKGGGVEEYLPPSVAKGNKDEDYEESENSESTEDEGDDEDEDEDEN